MKKLHLHIIIVCFGYILSLIASGTKDYPYNDLSPVHINANHAAISHASNKKYSLPLGWIASLVTPVVLVMYHLSIAAESSAHLCSLLTQFPSRASPA
jgi:hypothetical protein